MYSGTTVAVASNYPWIIFVSGIDVCQIADRIIPPLNPRNLFGGDLLTWLFWTREQFETPRDPALPARMYRSAQNRGRGARVRARRHAPGHSPRATTASRRGSPPKGRRSRGTGRSRRSQRRFSAWGSSPFRWTTPKLSTVG